MTSILEKRAAFLALHRPGAPFIIPNPWDIGSARILAGLGFKALATTSSGFACTLGRGDYEITRDEALPHAADLASNVDIPVSADLENGFDDTPDMVAETIRLAVASELCGGSIEDTTGDADNPIYNLGLSVRRIEAAVKATTNGFVLTARADGLLHGITDLSNIIERLQAYEAAGSDVLYAPGLPDLDAVHKVCSAVTKPVNILIHGVLIQHTAADFAGAGAARLSVGGSFAFNAYGTLAGTASMLEDGNFEALSKNRNNIQTVSAFLK